MNSLFEAQCWLKRFYRHGEKFQIYMRELERTQYYSEHQLKAYGDHHLQKMVLHCYENIPYYRDLMTSLRLKPEDIQTKAELRKLPLMDKQTITKNFDKLIDKKKKNLFCHTAKTSGSTGTPASLLRDFSNINFENAAIWRHWYNAGDRGKKRVTLRGDIIVPVSQSMAPFWKYNPANRELLMSGYHLAVKNSPAYIEKILEFQPDILYCYPSTGYLLAKLFKYHGISYTFNAIFTSSEALEPEVRRYMGNVFHAQVYDWYGQAERVAAMSQCAYGSYHIQEDYSCVETVPGEHGDELIGSHFHTWVMPLLRYRTGDYVTLDSKPCTCGSIFRRVKKIIGRTFNYFLTPEGYRISIVNHIPRGVDNLIETQFHQEKPGEIILKVLTNGKFTEHDKQFLIKNTLEHTSPSMKVVVQEVSNIPRGPNGKFVSIVNIAESEKGELEDALV